MPSAAALQISAAGTTVGEDQTAHETAEGVVTLNPPETALDGSAGATHINFWANRFHSVPITANAKILSVRLEIWVPAGATNLKPEKGEFNFFKEPGGCAVFTNAAKNITERLMIKVATEWIGTLTAGAWNVVEYKTKGLAQQLEELVGTTGWTQGNAVGFRWTVTNASKVNIENFAGTAEHAMKMIVEWETEKSGPFKSILASRPLTQGQIVKANRGLPKTLAVAQEQIVSLTKVPSKILKASQAQIASVARKAAEVFHVTITTITQEQSAALIKQGLRNLKSSQTQTSGIQKSVKPKTMKVGQEQNVSFSQARAFIRTFVITQSQEVFFISSLSLERLLTIVQTTSTNFFKGLTRQTTITQAQNISVTKSASKLFGLAQGQIVSTLAGRAFERALTVVQNTSVKLSKRPLKSLVVAQGQKTLLSRVLSKVLTIEQGQIVLRGTSLPRLLRVTQGQIPSIIKSFPRQFLVTQAQVISFKISKNFVRTFLITQAQQVRQSKGLSRFLSVVQELTVRVTAKRQHLAIAAMGRLVWNSNREGFADMKQFVGAVVKGTPDSFVFRLKRPFGPGSNIKQGTTKDPEWQ